jgi:hypothetical protein
MASPQDVITPITIANYGKDSWNGIAQHNPIAKLMLAKGNIRRNVGGTNLTWPLEAGRHSVTIVDDYQDISANYVPRKRFAQPTISWGEIVSQCAFSKGMFRQNTGDQALVNFRDVEVPAMFRDLMVGTSGIFHQFLNQAGAAYTGTGRPLYGLPSIVPSISWAAGSKTGTVSGTYGGLSTALSGIAVDGVEADAWTPTAVNSTSTAWAGGAGNATFRYNAFEILNYAIGKASRFSASDRRMLPDCGILDFTMYQDLGYQIGAKQSFYLTGKVNKGDTFGIGFNTNEGLSHGGIMFYWDENAVANAGWILNFSQIHLDVQPLVGPVSKDSADIKVGGDDDSMFETEVTYDPSRRGVLVSATFPGQFRIHPRYQTYIYAGA